jgi:hypothetical protein
MWPRLRSPTAARRTDWPSRLRMENSEVPAPSPGPPAGTGGGGGAACSRKVPGAAGSSGSRRGLACFRRTAHARARRAAEARQPPAAQASARPSAARALLRACRCSGRRHRSRETHFDGCLLLHELAPSASRPRSNRPTACRRCGPSRHALACLGASCETSARTAQRGSSADNSAAIQHARWRCWQRGHGRSRRAAKWWCVGAERGCAVAVAGAVRQRAYAVQRRRGWHARAHWPRAHVRLLRHGCPRRCGGGQRMRKPCCCAPAGAAR